jgi:hypothetical protein
LNLIDALPRVVWRAFFQVVVIRLGTSQQRLAIRRNFRVVRCVQILEHLLCDSIEYRRGNLTALMQADSRIENHNYGHSRIVYRRKTGK